MNKSNQIQACVLCTLATLILLCAEATAAPAPLSAAQIVSKNVAARGGLKAWRHIQTMTMSGQIDAGKVRTDGGQFANPEHKRARAEARAEIIRAVSKGEPAVDNTIRLPFQMDLKRPLKSRIEVRFKGDTAVQVFDGAQGWKLRPYLGRHEVEPYTQTEAKAALLQQELDGPLVDYVAKGTKVALEGTEQVNGSKNYKLKLTLKNGEVRHLWVDAKTFLDTRIDGAPRHFDGKMRQVATYFHDYKTVDGVKIPFVMETSVDGVNGSEKINIERVVMNPNLQDSRFTKPM
jgi:hypothetical protein